MTRRGAIRRGAERRIKDHGNVARLCPVCRQRALRAARDHMRAKRAAKKAVAP